MGIGAGFIFQDTTQGALHNMPKKCILMTRKGFWIPYVQIWVFKKISNVIRAYMQK